MIRPVALRKESVDRNNIALASSRACIVALRKESVDRNLGCNYPFKLFKRSLSARRAWIEIVLPGLENRLKTVALRKESVDRNALGGLGGAAPQGRSPQGERG